MTTFGGTRIYACSSCQRHISHMPLVSGNTIGARYWTDGWRDAPMLPEEPWLVKCPHCGACIWLDELQCLAVCERFGEPEPGFSDALCHSKVLQADYLDFAATNTELTAKKERYVRTKAWWRGNDPRRCTAVPEPLSAVERENLQRLFSFMSPDNENDRLMTAEIHRQLGDYHSATAALDADLSEDMQIAVRTIRDLAHKQKWSVAELKV